PRAMPRSTRLWTTCPCTPVTRMRMSGLGAGHQAEPLAIVAFAQGPPPPLVGEVPGHGLLDPAVEILARAPAEFGFEARRVDRIAGIVAGSVGDECDQALARGGCGDHGIEHRADPPHHRD